MKEIALPSAFISNIRQILKHENTPLVNLSLDSIHFDGEMKRIKKLNDFYERISNAFFGFANEDFYNFAVSDYESDQNPRKKYRYVPFDLCFQIKAQEQSHSSLCVHINITVSKRKMIIAEKSITHLWTVSNKRFTMKTKQTV